MLSLIKSAAISTKDISLFPREGLHALVASAPSRSSVVVVESTLNSIRVAGAFRLWLLVLLLEGGMRRCLWHLRGWLISDTVIVRLLARRLGVVNRGLSYRLKFWAIASAMLWIDWWCRVAFIQVFLFLCLCCDQFLLLLLLCCLIDRLVEVAYLINLSLCQFIVYIWFHSLYLSLIIWHFLQDCEVRLFRNLQVNFIFYPDSFTELVDFVQQILPQLLEPLIVNTYFLLFLWIKVGYDMLSKVLVFSWFWIVSKKLLHILHCSFEINHSFVFLISLRRQVC